MLSVDDLLQSKHLNLRLLNPGSNTKISNPVLWAHPTELPDPAPWLPEHSIILTLGAGLHGSLDSQRRLVRHAVLRQCSAIAFGLGVWLDTVPELIRQEADQCGLPLIEVPYEVSFAEVIKTINEHLFFEQNQPLFNANTLLHSLSDAYARSSSIDTFMRAARGLDPCLTQLHFLPVHDNRVLTLTEERKPVWSTPVQVGGVYAGEFADILKSAFVHTQTRAFYTSIMKLYLEQRISDLAHAHFQAHFHDDDRAVRLVSSEPTQGDRVARLNLIRKFVGHSLTAAVLKFPNLQAALVARWILDQSKGSEDIYFSLQNNMSVFVLRPPSDSFATLIERLEASSDCEIQSSATPVQFDRPDAGLDCFRGLLASPEASHISGYYTKVDSFFDFVDQSTSDAEKRKIVQAMCPDWPKMKRHERNFIVGNLDVHLRHFGRAGKISKILRISRQSWYQRLDKMQSHLSVDLKDPESLPPLWSFLTVASKTVDSFAAPPYD